MLLLRKESQKVLDRYKLNSFHVGKRNTHSLSIVGECGKSLVIINGISLPNKMTKDTREFAIELLESFLVKNIKIIDELITRKTAYNLSIDLKIDNIKVGSKKFVINLNDKNELYIASNYEVSLNDMENIVSQKLSLKKIKDNLLHNKKRHKEDCEIRNLEYSLNKCDI